MTIDSPRKIFLLAGLTFAIRIIFIVVFPGPNYFDGISESHLHVAGNVLEGRGIVTHVNLARLDETPEWQYVPFIHRPLGYLFFILIPLFLHNHPVSVQVLHALTSAGTALFVYSIGRTVTEERIAWRAAFLYSIWPLSARFEIAILPDAIMSFFLAAGMWCFFRSLRSHGHLWSGLTGLVLAAGMTMRPDILFYPLLFLGLLFAFKGQSARIARLLSLVFGIILILGLHTIRNYHATGGEIVPLGLGNGISLWEGISQFGDTLGTVYGDERMVRLEGYSTWAYPDGITRDRKRFREAVEIILAHPVWYTGVMLRRIPVLLTPDWIMTRKFAPSLKEFLDQSTDRSIFTYVVEYPIPAIIRGFLTLMQYVSLILAALAFWRHRKHTLLWLPALTVAYYVLIHIPTNSEARYFYPALPFVLLLASIGWEELKTIRRK